MAITIPYTFSPNTTILSAQVNANFTAAAGAVNAAGDTMIGTLNTQTLLPSTTAIYDLGSSTFKYRDLTISRNAVIGGTIAITGAVTVTSSSVTINGITYLWPASQSVNSVLLTDGSGNLTWGAGGYDILQIEALS